MKALPNEVRPLERFELAPDPTRRKYENVLKPTRLLDLPSNNLIGCLSVLLNSQAIWAVVSDDAEGMWVRALGCGIADISLCESTSSDDMLLHMWMWQSHCVLLGRRGQLVPWAPWVSWVPWVPWGPWAPWVPWVPWVPTYQQDMPSKSQGASAPRLAS